MTVVFVVLALGAGVDAGRPLQHMEAAAATVVVSWLVMGCWCRGGGDGVGAFQDGEEVSTTTVPYFRIAVGSCRWRRKRLIAATITDTIACAQPIT